MSMQDSDTSCQIVVKRVRELYYIGESHIFHVLEYLCTDTVFVPREQSTTLAAIRTHYCIGVICIEKAENFFKSLYQSAQSNS